MDRFGAAANGNVTMPVANAADRRQKINQPAGTSHRVASPSALRAGLFGHGGTGRVGQELMPPRHHARFGGRPLAGRIAKIPGIADVPADRTAKASAVEGAGGDAAVAQHLGGGPLSQTDGLKPSWLLLR